MHPLTSFLFRISVQCASSSEPLRTKKNSKNRKRKRKHEAGSLANRNHGVYLVPYGE